MPILIIFIVIVFLIARAVAQANAAKIIINQQMNLYNQAVEQQLRVLAAALRAHQPDVDARRREVEQVIRGLPQEQRKPYQRRLNRMMSAKTRLNPRTGEWEEQ